MTAACVFWYSTITIYVAIKGGADIKHMLKRLDATRVREEEEERQV